MPRELRFRSTPVVFGCACLTSHTRRRGPIAVTNEGEAVQEIYPKRLPVTLNVADKLDARGVIDLERLGTALYASGPPMVANSVTNGDEPGGGGDGAEILRRLERAPANPS
jgi:hypothetical protein